MTGTVETDEQNGTTASSFWECRAYQRTIKRVDAANKLCSELCLMIHERAELEKAYSANLRKWSARWLSFLESGMEYGTTACAWQGLCKEAEAISNAHQNVRNTLIDEIQTGIKHWQKEHFHKSPLPPQTLKESKLFEQDFETAQKPWAKRLKKVNLYQKDYYQACKLERSLQVQVQNAKNDPSGTTEQLKKIQDKLKKAEKDVERTRISYTNALNDANSESARYLEDMTKVFNRTQDFERERLVFFKDVFNNLQHALNVCEKVDYSSIYRDLSESISRCDVEADLKWWSFNHGVDMPAVFPQFEEYSPELTAISNKKRVTITDPNPSITLTSITPLNTQQTGNTTTTTNNDPPPGSDNNYVLSTNGPNSKIKTPFDNMITPPDTPSYEGPHDDATLQSIPTSGGDIQSKDEPIDPDLYASATYDDGRPGVKVRALYDYTGQEEDEISFKTGDIFYKLEEADDQGWCKGRKDGRAGLYPDNYAEEI